MRTKVITSFIDRRITTAIYDKKNVDLIIEELQNKIVDMKDSSKMPAKYVEYYICFAQKRLDDLQKFKSFNLPDSKALKFIQLLDKLKEVEDVEFGYDYLTKS